MTLLHWACRKRNVPVLRYIFENRLTTDPEPRDNYGRTPYYYAEPRGAEDEEVCTFIRWYFDQSKWLDDPRAWVFPDENRENGAAEGVPKEDQESGFLPTREERGIPLVAGAQPLGPVGASAAEVAAARAEGAAKADISTVEGRNFLRRREDEDSPVMLRGGSNKILGPRRTGAELWAKIRALFLHRPGVSWKEVFDEMGRQQREKDYATLTAELAMEDERDYLLWRTADGRTYTHGFKRTKWVETSKFFQVYSPSTDILVEKRL